MLSKGARPPTKPAASKLSCRRWSPGSAVPHARMYTFSRSPARTTHSTQTTHATHTPTHSHTHLHRSYHHRRRHHHHRRSSSALSSSFIIDCLSSPRISCPTDIDDFRGPARILEQAPRRISGPGRVDRRTRHAGKDIVRRARGATELLANKDV